MYRSKQVIVDNIAVSYWDEGHGSVLLFVHGWLDSKETFRKLIGDMKSEYRCIVVDLPNFGASQVSESVANIDTYASFLKAFLVKLSIGRYLVVGHSMGGQIAINAIGKGKIEPRGLVLIASSGVRNNSKLSKKLFKHLSFVLRRFIPKNFKNTLYKKLGSDYNTELSPVHKKIINNLLQTDVQGDAKNIDIPTLLIYGDADMHTPVSMGRVLNNAIQKSKLEVLAGADHWLHQSNAKIISDLIRKMGK
jgi:pimeloyl-ACP methyl ester carboxylesterase